MRALLAFAVVFAFGAQAQNAPPPFPAKNVPETFFGTVVDDPYRALEDASNPEVAAWAKAQAAFARATLDALPGYERLKKRIAELDESTSAVIGGVRLDANGNLFFMRRAAAENTLKLYRRDAQGAETLLVDPDDWQRESGRPHAINYFAPSPDGQLVAVGVSAAGSEEASIYLVDTATRQRIGEPISRAQYPRVSWRADSRSFFYLREQELKPGMPATEKYRYERSYLHLIGTPVSSDVLVAGPEVSPRMDVQPEYQPWIVANAGSRFAVAHVANGDQRDIALYAAPLVTLGKPGTPWVRVCDFTDKVTAFAVHGDDIYLLTYRDSPRFSVLRTRLTAPDMAHATPVVAPSDRVLVRMVVAKDALYLEARDGTLKRLMRRRWGARQAVDVALPREGAAHLVAWRAERDGAIFGLTTWTRAQEIYSIDRAGKVANTRLQPLGQYDAPAGLVATEVKVKSHDGALVPLSIIHRADIKLDGTNPTILNGYGSYGITSEPYYQATRLAWLERGGVYAVANVRGSGVYGHDWYLAGKKANKPNTWKDLIACAEYLIAQKYTSKQHLGILGGSAGGITVGRAMTERPDLFAAVVPVVGVLDAVRAELTANGVPNIPEFGTVKKEDEFRALLAMSSYHHVKDGTAYPAVLLIHGVNDPRVEWWQSAKMAARLQAATSSGKPVLLDLDYDAGHGIGSTKLQRQRQAADYYSFLFWQTGRIPY